MDKKSYKKTKVVDKGLIAAFLRLSPDERLRSNDNMARTIMELKNAYKKRRGDGIRSERNT